MPKKKSSRRKVEPKQEAKGNTNDTSDKADKAKQAAPTTVVSAVDMASLRFDDETPEAWMRKIVGLEDGTGAPVAKLRLEVRQTRAEPFRRVLEIPLRDRSPMEVVHQVETEAGNSGYRLVRVSAWFTRGKAPVSIYLWPTDDVAIEEEEGLGGKPSDVLRQLGSRVGESVSLRSDRCGVSPVGLDRFAPVFAVPTRRTRIRRCDGVDGSLSVAANSMPSV